MSVTAHTSVQEFFHEVVVDALVTLKVNATSHTELYLVALLGDYANARLPDEPLSVKLIAADGASPSERVRALKEVGDTSLYVTGFFAESFERRLVEPEYYITLGTAAYGQLARRLADSASFREVYSELSVKFPTFVDVLQEVRAKVCFAGTDLVQLYEEWLRTRSEWLERRLRAVGALVETPRDDAGDEIIH